MTSSELSEQRQTAPNYVDWTKKIRRKLFVDGTLRTLALTKLFYSADEGFLIVKLLLFVDALGRIPSLLQQKSTSMRPNVALASATTA